VPPSSHGLLGGRCCGDGGGRVVLVWILCNCIIACLSSSYHTHKAVYYIHSFLCGTTPTTAFNPCVQCSVNPGGRKLGRVFQQKAQAAAARESQWYFPVPAPSMRHASRIKHYVNFLGRCTAYLYDPMAHDGVEQLRNRPRKKGSLVRAFLH